VSREMEILSWLLFIIFIAALLIVGGLLLRGYLNTGSPTGALKDALAGNFFGPKPPKRLEVTDQANVDGRRKLLLIRRDGVEHLIMTGGPVDVVIETGIRVDEARASIGQSEPAEASTAIYPRTPRPVATAVGESS
jgi:flagellar protein FliO/FliZ